MNDEFASQSFETIAPHHDASSPSSHLLDELASHGYRPLDDEPDPRPLPSSDAASLALESAVEALSNLFLDTRLEADFPDLLWSFVNLFHRKAQRIDRELDDNETAQRRSQSEQDGSEIRSVELERLIAQGLTLTERRNAFEFFRDHLAELYATETGSSWRPRSGSQVNHRALTAAMIDSRDFLNAKKLAETQVLLPPGPRIAFAGGADCNDHQRIWDTLDKVRAKHPDMVLLHGAGPEGAERIAACWADNRNVPRSPSNRNGHATRTRRRSSATTPCSRPCPSGSSFFRDRGSSRTSPTRLGRWEFRCGGSRKAARPPKGRVDICWELPTTLQRLNG